MKYRFLHCKSSNQDSFLLVRIYCITDECITTEVQPHLIILRSITPHIPKSWLSSNVGWKDEIYIFVFQFLQHAAFPWFSKALFLSQGPKPWDRLPNSKMSSLLTQTADGHTTEIYNDVPACSTKPKQNITQSLEPETLELCIPSPDRATTDNTI